MAAIVLDVNNMLSPQLGERGITPQHLTGELSERFREAHRAVEVRREAGHMGFMDLPAATQSAHQVQEVADSFGQWFENLVILGIGGSSLGAR